MNTTNGNTGEVTTMSAADSLRAKMLALASEQQKQRETAGTLKAVKTPTAGRLIDAFGAPAGSGTAQMHAILAEAYAVGAYVTSAIFKAEGVTRPIAGHLNTMRDKGRAQSDGRGHWRLTDAAGAHWHGEGKTFGFALAEAKAAEELAKAQAEELAKAQAEADAKAAEELAKAEAEKPTAPAESIETPTAETAPAEKPKKKK